MLASTLKVYSWMNHKTEKSNTVAWIALAVAIVSASLSLVQYLENLKQNAILLAPNLSIISEKGRTLKQGLYLQNTGFGPAEIVSFRVRFMGSEIPDLQHINDELVDSEGKYSLRYGLSRSQIAKIVENAEMRIFEPNVQLDADYNSHLIQFDADTFDDRITRDQFLGLIEIQIEYCSVRDNEIRVEDWNWKENE